MMYSLFPGQSVYPDGFTYASDFITPAEEEELLAHMVTLPLRNFRFQGHVARRKTFSFGYDYSFSNKSLSQGEVIPEFFKPLVARVARHLSLDESEFAELLVTEYPHGSVINWHRDAPPFKLIAGISLLSDCKFRLRKYENSVESRRSIISFPVARRSLYIIQGTARTEWQHSIAPADTLRYSITLRTLYPALTNANTSSR